jgi:hypothetical protein
MVNACTNDWKTDSNINPSFKTQSLIGPCPGHDIVPQQYQNPLVLPKNKVSAGSGPCTSIPSACAFSTAGMIFLLLLPFQKDHFPA